MADHSENQRIGSILADFEENLTGINMSIKPSERDLAGSGAFSHKI